MQQFGELLGFISQSFETVSGPNDDVPINSMFVTITPTSDGDTIRGMLPTIVDSVPIVFLINISLTNSLVLSNDLGNSTPTFGFFFVGGTKLSLAPGQTAIVGHVPGLGWTPVLQGTLS